ncbi:protoporphyrinogen oxidase [Pokkaliibacter sp. CJK22405]|uniref:protoporphyrinogen oxidase n=1 Tax=Pokkaliibacter sp. CJK22405 TaxID=3384615 RepID=UPI003984F21B
MAQPAAPQQTSKRIIVVGGGISGLASAWFLQHRGHIVTLLESKGSLGGNLATLEEAGFLIERGPNSTLDNRPALGELIDHLGLADERLAPSSAAKRRFVVRDGKLVALPGSPQGFLSTPLFSWKAKLRLGLEPFIGKAAHEETIAAFVRRRLGKEFLDYAINPFVSGVYAGDPEKLSVQAATARVYELEKSHGSLLKGAWSLMKARKSKTLETGPSGTLTSFRGGLGQLARALVQQLENHPHCHVRTHANVAAVEQTRSGWSVAFNDERINADAVVLATPAHVTARLLESQAPEASSALENIEYPEVLSISMAFDRQQVAHALDGFGMLIPRCEGVKTLGTLFPSSIFTGRAPAGKVLLTSFIGGRLNPQVAELSDQQLSRQVLADIAPLLGIVGQPEHTWVTRWPQAIPQYEVGHLERLAEIETALAELPGLYLRSNWRDGISVADCIQQAALLAERL